MKKPFILLFVVIAFLAFVACEKDGGSGKKGGLTSLSGTIENMPTAAEKYELRLSLMLNLEVRVVAVCDVAANGKFSLNLPETVDEDDLTNLVDVQELNSPEITFSNPDAKVGSAFIALYGDGERIDVLVHANAATSEFYAQLIMATPTYCDSNCTATGSFSWSGLPTDVDMSFVKGWNWFTIDAKVGLGPDNGASITTKRPAQAKWYLNDDFMQLVNP